MKAPALLLSVILFSAACSGGGSEADGRVKVVASIYPLAWITERIGGSRVEVTDLTPPGVEAHEVSLTAEQRADISEADVLVHVGDIGFQPDVEAAMDAAGGKVVNAEAAGFLEGSGQYGSDPHVWLDPVRLAGIAADVSSALQESDPEHAADYAGRSAKLLDELTGLNDDFDSGLKQCEFRTFVTTHAAFGYLAAAYELSQEAIQGIVPESEPDAASIEYGVELIKSGEAAPVVFSEPTDEGQRIAEAVASDAGASTATLNPIETEPEAGDYLSSMRANLATLEEGLRCS
jgi:zinc transport system substrate-binding protein